MSYTHAQTRTTHLAALLSVCPSAGSLRDDDIQRPTPNAAPFSGQAQKGEPADHAGRGDSGDIGGGGKRLAKKLVKVANLITVQLYQLEMMGGRKNEKQKNHAGLGQSFFAFY